MEDRQIELTLQNLEAFEKQIATFMPELLSLWQLCVMYRINMDILPYIAKAIGDISIGTGVGKVTIEIVQDTATGDPLIYRVNGTEVNKIRKPALRNLT